MDRDSVKICWEKKKDGLDRRESVKEEVVELEEKEFFKEGKNT